MQRDNRNAEGLSYRLITDVAASSIERSYQMRRRLHFDLSLFGRGKARRRKYTCYEALGLYLDFVESHCQSAVNEAFN